MKYDPTYHSSVVSNYRAKFKEKYDGVECKLTDEQVWGCCDSEVAPTSEEQEEWTLEAMKDLHDSK